MARGRHAIAAAGRREQAARDLIDRLTDQIADLKIRLKTAQEGAATATALRRRADELQAVIDEDTAAREIWKLVDSISESWGDWLSKTLPEHRLALGRLIGEFADRWQDPHLARKDKLEYIIRKYPRLFSGKAAEGVVNGRPLRLEYNNLSDEAVRRIQAVRGERSIGPTDTGDQYRLDMAALLLEIDQVIEAGFSTEEAFEYLGIDQDERQGV